MATFCAYLENFQKTIFNLESLSFLKNIDFQMKNRIYENTRPNHLLALGLDNKDGHIRLTQAEQFSIFGGSKETHERMTVTLIETFKKLQQKGKRLEQTEPHELADIIKKVVEQL